MLARVAVSPDALAERLGAVGPAKAQHAWILQIFLAHGCLLFSCEEDARRFVGTLRNGAGMPPGVAQRWLETVLYLREAKRVQVVGSSEQESISSIDSVASLRRVWNDHVELAVLGERAAQLLGVPEEEGVTTDPRSNIEIARMFGVPLAKTFTSLRELADTAVVPRGESRDSFWASVLGPVATMSTAVTVLDSYLFGEIWWRGASRRGGHPEHLVWLLERLDETMRPKSQVELIASIDPSRRNAHSLEETADLIRRFWRPRPSGRIAHVQIVGVNNRDFPHDRHIRFNTGIAITFDAGVDRLRREMVEDPNGMAWGHKWHRQAIETLKEREQRARKLPGVAICEVI